MDTTVQLAQGRLLALGYDLGPAKADGVAGRMTIAAIMKFQIDKKVATKFPGILDAPTLAALGVSVPATPVEPPWITHARQYLGLNEVKDAKVLDYALGVDASVTAWCGAFVGMNIAAALPREPLPTNMLWALNWLKFGVALDMGKPVMGAIGASERNGGGHVFFIIGHDKSYFHILGGNQGNSVSIVKKLKSDVKGLRYPSTYPLPSSALPISTFTGKLAGSEA
jgi:uncharacterized protein (TIGR02594 family)